VSFGHPEAGQIQHKFNFQVKAIERFAEMNYTGFFNSTVVYKMDSNFVTLNITKPLDSETSVSLSENTPMDNIQWSPNVSFLYHF
jgi:hypothetical protein